MNRCASLSAHCAIAPAGLYCSPSTASDEAGHLNSGGERTDRPPWPTHRQLPRALVGMRDSLAGQGPRVQVSRISTWAGIGGRMPHTGFAKRRSRLPGAPCRRRGSVKQRQAMTRQAGLASRRWAACTDPPIYWFRRGLILRGGTGHPGSAIGGKRFYIQGGLAGKEALNRCSLGGR